VYNAELPEGAKEETTLIGERRHQRYFKKHLRASVIVQSLSVADVQRYVSVRSRDLCNGEPISPETIAKELATFRLIWNWAVDRDYLKGPSPTKGVRLPKSADKPPFMTRGEIEQKIERGGLSEKQIKRLWASLFLTREDIAAVLDHVRQNAARSFIYPMFVFTAHTGARRSEVLRSRIDDFNLDTGVVGIREKKKRKNRKITFRHVDLTPLLTQTMRDWFDSHPGGQFTICDDPTEIPDGLEDDEVGMSPYKAQNHFDRVLSGSEWSKIRGFHVLRHSFASNLAAAGVDQRVIDEWMGHQTEEMRRRYRHLFPKQRRSAIESVFGDGQ
jgi:integrase